MQVDYGGIPARTIAAGTLLLHVSRTIYRGSPPYFGTSSSCRYDDPERKFGVLYVAEENDLPTALMETVFHDHRWARRRRRVLTKAELYGRMVRMLGVLNDFALADLTQPNVIAARLGLNLHQVTRRPYRTTQQLTRNIFETGVFDGICYLSRNNPPASCFALFDRIEKDLEVACDIDLNIHRSWPGFVRDFGIAVTP